jgi:glycerol-3-phosphate acyltransferase PlsY
MLAGLLLIVAAYLLGSVSTAVVVTRIKGLPDPRTLGSRNPGATNVLRYGGRGAAVLTLLGDVLKGFVPVAVGAALGLSPLVLGLTALAAFLGHLFPVFFGFQGGKGVATALGALFGLAWPVGLAAVSTWVLVALTTRYSSLAALTAALLTPLYTAWLRPELPVVAATGAMAVLLVWRHAANIRKLLAGEESRIGERAPAATAPLPGAGGPTEPADR